MHHFKMNVLHLHLSDDQGFRFGSEAFPELVSTDNYSMDELRQLIAYAADLGVRVVPELDVPGHTSSWLVKHPEWGFGEVNEDELKGVWASSWLPRSIQPQNNGSGGDPI